MGKMNDNARVEGTRRDVQRQWMAVAILLGSNMGAVAIIAGVVKHYMDAGVIDNTLGLVMMGLVSSVAVSVISTVAYERLKSMFGLTKWQKGVDDKLDMLLEGQEKMLKMQEETNRLLREILAILRSGSVKIVVAEPGEAAAPPGAGDNGGGGAAADSGSR